MLSELSQTEKDKYCTISLICGILKRKPELIETESRLVVAKGKTVWKMGEGGQRGQTSSYKMNKF